MGIDGRICRAVENGDTSVLESVVAHGLATYFNKCYRYKQNVVTPLELAFRKMALSPDEKYATMASFMLQHGANPNAVVAKDNGETLLHQVASWLSMEAVRLLLEHGANPNVVDDLGRSPLHAASLSLSEWSFFTQNSSQKQKCDAVTEALIDAGANPETKDMYGYTSQDYIRRSFATNWHTGTLTTATFALDAAFALDAVWDRDGECTRCPSEASDSCSEASDGEW
jgi:hypothetical protein